MNQVNVETLSEYVQVGLWLLEQSCFTVFFTRRQGKGMSLLKPLRLQIFVI